MSIWVEEGTLCFMDPKPNKYQDAAKDVADSELYSITRFFYSAGYFLCCLTSFSSGGHAVLRLVFAIVLSGKIRVSKRKGQLRHSSSAPGKHMPFLA